MGVHGLASLLKQVASETVDLNVGKGTIIYDGHACMHRSASKGKVALALALDNNVRELALDMLIELRRAEEKGWCLVVVFDGATPPSKDRTSNSRSSTRSDALRQCRHLQAQQPIDQRELEKQAKRAVAFTPEIVLRVSQILRHSLRVDCITAPFEADPQLKVMEDVYCREGQRCFVRANDSDLIVLGVRSLLWDVSIERDGRMFGKCITLSSIVRPQIQILSEPGSGSDFLRHLHGVANGTPCTDSIWWSPDKDKVLTNLRNWACVAGNDYTDFRGIGPARAKEFAMPHGETRSVDQIAEALAHALKAEKEGVLVALNASVDMFCHAVVWNPSTGAHQHLSGRATTVGITSNTGRFVE